MPFHPDIVVAAHIVAFPAAELRRAFALPDIHRKAEQAVAHLVALRLVSRVFADAVSDAVAVARISPAACLAAPAALLARWSAFLVVAEPDAELSPGSRRALELGIDVVADVRVRPLEEVRVPASVGVSLHVLGPADDDRLAALCRATGPSLRELNVHDCAEVTTVEPLAWARQLRVVSLFGLQGTVSLEPLRGIFCVRLADCDLSACDVAPLGASYAVSLSWCRLPASIAALRGVLAITLVDTNPTDAGEFGILEDATRIHLVDFDTRALDHVSRASFVSLVGPRGDARQLDFGCARHVHLAGFGALEDLSPLRGIASVFLEDCPVSDLAPLTEATAVFLWRCNSVSSLRGLERVETVGLFECAQLVSLEGLASIRVAFLVGCPIATLEPLRGIAIEQLTIDSLPIRDLDPVRTATAVRIRGCAEGLEGWGRTGA